MLPIFINTHVMRKASYALASIHLAFSINSFLIFSAIGFSIHFELISLEKFSLYILFIQMKEFGLSFFWRYKASYDMFSDLISKANLSIAILKVPKLYPSLYSHRKTSETYSGLFTSISFANKLCP